MEDLFNRRRFVASGLKGLGAAAGAATIGEWPALAQSTGGAQTKPHRIDVHHHFLPPKHVERILALRESGRPPQWSAELSLAEMDKNGVATAISSLVQPGVWFGDAAESRALSRYCNEYGAQMVKDHPGRFGFFACLPLPDIEDSLHEIEYALDTLKADGIGLLTQHDGKYLGDPLFAPVYEELNRRKAVVYVHPTQPVCCTGLVKNVTVATIEYATDSSRTIASLLFSGTAARFPEIRFIFSHGGGTVPFLLSRFENLAADRKDAFMPHGAAPELRKFHYEVGQANHRGALDALLTLVPVSHVLFGSDYPLRPIAEAREGVIKYPFSSAQRHAVERDNAVRLLPRLKA